MSSGLSPPADSHSTQSATVGQVSCAALDPTTRPKCPARIVVLVDLGVGRRPADTAHRRGLTDVVDLADERQHGAGDVGERDQLAVDGEAAGHHPVVRDELLEQLGDRRAGPGNPALRVQESALLLAGQQRLAVVQLAHEVDPGLGGLERVEHLEIRCAPSSPGCRAG